MAVRKAGRGSRFFVRTLTGLLSFAVFLYAMFVFSFGAGYRTTSLSRRLGLDRQKVTAEELAEEQTDEYDDDIDEDSGPVMKM